MKTRNLCIIFLLWQTVFLAIYTPLYAFTLPRQYALVRDMQADWQVYDAQYGAYVPYFAERHNKPKSVSFWLDLDDNQHYILMFKVKAPLYFFINGTLCKSFTPKNNHKKNENSNDTMVESEKNTWIGMQLDSLKKLFPEDSKIFCTLYDPQKNLPLSALCIVTKNIPQETILKTPIKTDTLTRMVRPANGKDWAVMVSIFLLVVFTLLWNIYPRGLLSYMSFQSSLSPLARKDMNLLQKPLGLANLLLIFGHSFQIAVVFWVYQMTTTAQSLGSLAVLGNYFYIGLLVFSLFFLKYLFLRVSGVLLNTSKSIVNMHFFEFGRLSYIFYSVLLILPLYCWISAPQYMPMYVDSLKYLLLIFHLLQSFFVSFWVFKQIEYKNLYLFYYLCTTEIVPLLFGMKWLIIS